MQGVITRLVMSVVLRTISRFCQVAWVTLPKKGSIANLNLYAGTLKVGEELEVTGDLNIGSTGMFDLSTGTLDHSGQNLTYSGNTNA